MARILILGGGFGGLVAAENLAAELDAEHQITLVSPECQFIFYPDLVSLVFGGCAVDDISFDLSVKLKSLGVRFVQGEVIRINRGRRTVQVTGADFSGEIGFDYLVIAMGRRLATEKIGGFFEHAHHLLSPSAAQRFGQAVGNFCGGRIVVGMCPGAHLPVPVFETAFALAKRFEDEVRALQVEILVVLPGSLEEAFGGASPYAELEAACRRRRINVLYDVPVREVAAGEIASLTGHRIDYDLLMLLPPFRGQAILRSLGITDASDYVLVDDRMRVFGLEKAYAAGDAAALAGPKLAHMAVRQAAVAAANIAAEIRGEAPENVYCHEMETVIDGGGADSIYLHYGIWDDELYDLKKGRFWSWAKSLHAALWKARHS